MKKIIIIISILTIFVAGTTFFYFQNIHGSNISSENTLKLLPQDASVVFAFKNENSFYQIFRDFTLFSNIIGKSKMDELAQLKIILNNDDISEAFKSSEFYISLHQADSNVELLLLAPITNKYLFNNSIDDFINDLKIKVEKLNFEKFDIYCFNLKNNKKYYFSFHKSVIIGSVNKSLIERTLKTKNKSNTLPKAYSYQSSRNKNAIANLYINFKKIPNIIQPMLKFPMNNLVTSFNASSILNINYQSNAFMFNGVTIPDTVQLQYQNLFLAHTPGELSFRDILPAKISKFSGFYLSNTNLFIKDLKQYFKEIKIYDRLQNQMNMISKKHSYLFEKELSSLIGNDFGTFTLSNGENLGIININNTQRAKFSLSIISSEFNSDIKKLNEDDIFYYLLGDPFKKFTHPYYAFINDYIIISNNASSLIYVINQINQQNSLINDKNYNNFQQYLTNRGNIFLYFNNRNSQSIMKKYMKSHIYNYGISNELQMQNWFGFSLQFSSDKDKYYTNFYLNTNDTSKKETEINIDSLLR